MISIKSKNVIESKAVPGVRFTVRTLNKIQRAARDFPIASARAHIADLLEEYFAIKATPEADRTPGQVERLNAIDYREYSAVYDAQIVPANLRAGIVSIEGLEIDGAPATAQSLIDSGGADYDALITEMNDACEAASRLTPTETKNSQSDTTSTGQVETDPTTSPVASAGN